MNKRKTPGEVGPRKAPKQERSRQTYQVILNGATSIIRRDGLKKLSTNKVAEESGVSIGSLYQYFPSKQAIIAALIDQVLEQELQRVTELVQSLKPELGPLQIARTFFLQYYHLNEEDLNVRRTLVDAVPNVERSRSAMQFHAQMAEMIVGYFKTHFQIESADPATQLFVIQYLSKGVTLSSVDEQLQGLEREKVIEEWAHILLTTLKVPESSFNQRQ